MKFLEQIWEKGKIIQTIFPADKAEPELMEKASKIKPFHSTIGDTQFEQHVVGVSETPDYFELFIKCKQPPSLPNLSPFNVNFGFIGWGPYYTLQEHKKEGITTYKAFAPLKICPVSIKERVQFKFIGAPYKTNGDAIGEIEIYFNCSVREMQTMCSRYHLELPKANIIVSKNDLFSLVYDLDNIIKPKTIKYHDVRGFYG
jgi:hypothetical protein